MGLCCRLLDLSVPKWWVCIFYFLFYYFVLLWISNLNFEYLSLVQDLVIHCRLPNQPTNEYWIYYKILLGRILYMYKLWFDPFLNILMSLRWWFHFCMSVWFNSNFVTISLLLSLFFLYRSASISYLNNIWVNTCHCYWQFAIV